MQVSFAHNPVDAAYNALFPLLKYASMLFPDFDPVALALEPIAIHWYGLMYLLAFASFWWLGRRRARQGAFISIAQMDDLVFYGALGVVVGGRLGYVFFYNFSAWLADPLMLFKLWEGGMSFHGGFLGVALALLWFARRQGLAFWPLADFVAPLVPLGLFAGRMGNFINGELWGGPTSAAWGMQVACAGRYDLCVNKLGLAPGVAYTPALHPSQLYEAFLEGLLLFALLWLYSRKPRAVPTISGLFLVGYGSARFFVEFFRMPDSHLGYLAFDWFTMGQLLSLPMILLGLGLILWAQSRKAGIHRGAY
jgi:phosphatidylglycerol:prolipoprotein diacylglycerol transferase